MFSDVEITFEREGFDGVVAVGTYVSDAAKRFGIAIDEDCVPKDGVHLCEVTITKGAALLSPMTERETEHFAVTGRKGNERLACEAQIKKSGEVVIMTKEKAQEPKAETPKDPFHEEFSALPLEKKIARLMKMEAETFSETIAYVVNSPMKVVEKVGDVIAEFGIKIEKEAKKAARPSEASTEAKDATNGDAKPKGTTRSRTTTRKPKT